MPLHKIIPLCSFKYVGESISSSATFKYDTVGKLSKNSEIKIYYAERRDIVKDECSSLNGNSRRIFIEEAKILYDENKVINKEQSKELDVEINCIDVERSKELGNKDQTNITKEQFKELYNNIRIINKYNLKIMYTNRISITKDNNKNLYRFIMGITKEDLKVMSLNHSIGINLNAAKSFENIDDYRKISLAVGIELETSRLVRISKADQINLSRNLDYEISNIADERSLIAKSIDPYLNKSDQKILEVNRATEMNILTGLEVILIRDHELNKNYDYSLICENTLSMDYIESAKYLFKHAIFSIDKSDQVSLSNISMVNMCYDLSNRHYLSYGGMINLKDTFINKPKLLKLQNVNDMLKLNDFKYMSLSVFRKMNILNTRKIMQNVEIRDIFKNDIVSLQQIRWENINIEESRIVDRMVSTFTISYDKDLDRVAHCNIYKTNDAQLTYDHHTLIDIESNIELSHSRRNEVLFSDQNKYLDNESEILINYSKFRNVNAIHPNTNILKSDDKELATIRDVRPIMLNDKFALDHKAEHEINKESNFKIAASHYDELLKADTKNLSYDHPKDIYKDVSKFVSKFGKIINKADKNKFVYGSKIVIDKSEPVMMKPYGSIGMLKNTNRLMHKTYKLIGKIDDLKALKGYHKEINTDDHNKRLNKLVIPIFNNYDAKWLNKDKIEIITYKQKFIEETPWNIDIDQVYFLNKDRIDIFTQNQKPMYRERMPIIYDVPPHLLEITKRWWVLGAHGPYDYKILPFDYGYLNAPLWINRRDREFGGHFMKLKNHPISYMPYLEGNKGKDLHYGTHEIALSIEIMLDMVNILVMIFKHSSSQFANCSGQEAIEFIMELFFDWLNLESTKDEMARKGSREHYLRCYRWLRWEAEKVWFIADKDHTQDRLGGIKFAGMLVRNVLEYMKNHHFNVVPLWQNVTFMDIERQFNRYATSGDIMKELDKLKGKRHYFIETKNLGGNKI